MREYWQYEFYTGDHKRTRYFYGTEAAAQRRAKRYTADKKDLVKLDRSFAKNLKMEQKVRFIDL